MNNKLKFTDDEIKTEAADSIAETDAAEQNQPVKPFRLQFKDDDPDMNSLIDETEAELEAGEEILGSDTPIDETEAISEKGKDAPDPNLSREDCHDTGNDKDTNGEQPDSDSRLKTTKQDKKISKLEDKAEKYSSKRDKVRGKIPVRKKKIKERLYNESKNKAETKIRFENETIPIDKAKWNLPRKRSLPIKAVTAVATMGVNKLHTEIYKVERENVGVSSAHSAELAGESAYRGGRKLIHSAYRHIKNSPYRKSARFETKVIKTRMKLDYQKVLKDNPKLKNSPASRFMQKRQIKRKYAEAIRTAKKSGQTLKQGGGVINKMTQIVIRIIRRNPTFIIVAGFLLLLVFAVISLISLGGSVLGNTGATFGIASYAANEEDIVDRDSLALVEQIRTIDRSRLYGYIGRISDKSQAAVDQALSICVGLERRRAPKGEMLVLTLCRHCENDFRNSGYIVVKMGWQNDKESCDFCKTGKGFSFGVFNVDGRE